MFGQLSTHSLGSFPGSLVGKLSVVAASNLWLQIMFCAVYTGTVLGVIGNESLLYYKTLTIEIYCPVRTSPGVLHHTAV